MIYIKQQLNKKEKLEIYVLIQSIPDSFGEFYLTKNNLRLFIKENFSHLLSCLKKGDKILFCDDGIAIVMGWADKNPRKYVKILAKSNGIADNLLKVILWNFNKIDLFTKLKWRNPIRKVFYRNGFEFKAGRGKEVLLLRKKNIERFEINKKE